MDDDSRSRKITEIAADPVLIQNALNKASRDASLMQKRVGYPVVIINHGKTAWIPTDDSEE